MAALALFGCGADTESATDAASPPSYTKALAAAPPTLEALYENGGKLVPGGLDAFSQQLDEVQGYPVVVNNWASWCNGCRVEWPWFQDAAAKHLDEVAFIGVVGDDSDDAAETYLEGYPVPYPSYADPEKKLTNVTGFVTVGGLPNTLFFDKDGELVYSRQGQYEDQAALNADIEKYALID